MKKNYWILFLAFIGLVGCQDNEEITAEESLSTTTVAEAVTSMYLTEELTDLVNTSMEASNLIKAGISNDLSENSGFFTTSRVATQDPSDSEKHKFKDNEYGSCASITIDTLNNTKVIDFGSGCVNKHGRLRAGKIVITYSDIKDEVGAFRQVEFVDFYKDSINIQGTQRMEVINIDAEGNKTIQTSLTGGKMVYPNGTFETKNAVMVRYKYRSDADPNNHYTTLTGSLAGTDSEGVSFSTLITKPIRFVRNCDPEKGRKMTPVEGTKTITTDTQVTTIDFGDGSCDTLVDVTTNGVTETVDLSTLKRERKFKRLHKKWRKKGD